ncbi:high mobility group B protein 14-like isoform X2 [Musa acuminata AAA Group]|uniref:high mobility group B protein 14-like isoform X2 n=1 Tax=Musa acuminata AAA Group TaxID=214697 RepID=UPI0031DB3AD1
MPPRNRRRKPRGSPPLLLRTTTATSPRSRPPLSSTIYFRKTFQQENPNVKSMRDIGKACGEKWKTMSFEEKVAYYDIATEKRAEFEKAMAAYIKRKESGEFSEGSDDYE